METPLVYVIGGKKYTQKKLVLGQLRQMLKLLEGLNFPADAKPEDYLAILGDRIPRAIGIVLCEEDKHLKDKDLKSFTEELEFSIDAETTVKVVEDFFACNPVASLLETLGSSVNRIAEKVQTAAQTIGSKPSSADSPEEISQKERASSGDTS